MTDTTKPHIAWSIALWVAQLLLALAFGLFGSMKAFQPLDELAKMMHWVPTMQPWFVRGLGVAEMLGAVGIVLPALTRIMPRLTVLAALCFVVVQLSAITLHAMRGETAQSIPLNLILIALAAFVLWGRSKKAVIAPRT